MDLKEVIIYALEFDIKEGGSIGFVCGKRTFQTAIVLQMIISNKIIDNTKPTSVAFRELITTTIWERKLTDHLSAARFSISTVMRNNDSLLLTQGRSKFLVIPSSVSEQEKRFYQNLCRLLKIEWHYRERQLPFSSTNKWHPVCVGWLQVIFNLIFKSD